MSAATITLLFLLFAVVMFVFEMCIRDSYRTVYTETNLILRESTGD